MTHKRVRKFIVQPIIETLDEDGNLVGEEARPPEPLYHPYDLAALTVRIERELYEQAREEARR